MAAWETLKTDFIATSFSLQVKNRSSSAVLADIPFVGAETSDKIKDTPSGSEEFATTVKGYQYSAAYPYSYPSVEDQNNSTYVWYEYSLTVSGAGISKDFDNPTEIEKTFGNVCQYDDVKYPVGGEYGGFPDEETCLEDQCAAVNGWWDTTTWRCTVWEYAKTFCHVLSGSGNSWADSGSSCAFRKESAGITFVTTQTGSLTGYLRSSDDPFVKLSLRSSSLTFGVSASTYFTLGVFCLGFGGLVCFVIFYFSKKIAEMLGLYTPEEDPSQQPPAQGYPPQGAPPSQGYPPQGGYPTPGDLNGDGIPDQYQGGPQGGYPPQGYPPQGYPPQGAPPQGYPPQGYPPQGYPPQGAPPQGYPPQGGYPTPGDLNGDGIPDQYQRPY